MNSKFTHENFRIFFKYENHSSIDKDLDKTQKALNKEDRNQYALFSKLVNQICKKTTLKSTRLNL